MKITIQLNFYGFSYFRAIRLALAHSDVIRSCSRLIPIEVSQDPRVSKIESANRNRLEFFIANGKL